MQKPLLQTLLVAVLILVAACQTNTNTPVPTPPASPTSAPVAQTVQPTDEVAPPPTSTPPPPTATPIPKDQLAVLGVVGQPQSLNPITQNNAALREITSILFDTLLHVDPQTGRLQPGLADRWEYSANGKQVKFFLPSNLKWSDGSPMTAADIADSLQATQHPALLSFSKITAPDDTTLALTFIDIDCAAVTNLGLLPLLPATQILEPMPTGSGPFMVAEWPNTGPALNLVRNPNYHGDPPHLAGLTVRFIEQDEVKIVVSEGAGRFDTIGPLPIKPDTPANFAIETYPAAQMLYMAINFDPLNEPPFKSGIRRALHVALDREAILAEALQGEGQLLPASLPGQHWAADDSLLPPGYEPERASTLLRQAGLRDSDGDGWLDQDGKRVELDIRLNGKNPLHQRLGWLISSYYRDLGLFARAESVPPDSVVDDLFTHDFQLAIFNWPILPDPDQRMFFHSEENEPGYGLNVTSYSNKKVDSLLEEGVSVVGCQPEERTEIYAELQDIFSRKRPLDFLMAPNRHLLVGNRLAGVQPGPFAPFTHNAVDWRIEE